MLSFKSYLIIRCCDIGGHFCSEGKIHDFGEDALMSGKYSVSDFDSVIDVPNMSVIPGLIDAHTHPVWDGDRVHEFGMKV